MPADHAQRKTSSPWRKGLLRYGWLAVLLLGLSQCSLSHPSDEQMIANFLRQEAAFHQLVDMIRKDVGLTRVDDTWTWPHDPSSIGIQSERIQAYRTIFEELDVPRGFSADHGSGAITLIASTLGLAISGSIKPDFLGRFPEIIA